MIEDGSLGRTAVEMEKSSNDLVINVRHEEVIAS